MTQYQAPVQHPTEMHQPSHTTQQPRHDKKRKGNNDTNIQNKVDSNNHNKFSPTNNTEIDSRNINKYSPTNNNHVNSSNTNHNAVSVGNENHNNVDSTSEARSKSDSSANSDSSAYNQNNISQGDSNSAASLTQGDTTNEFNNKTITIQRDNNAFYGYRGGTSIPNPFSLNLDVLYDTERSDDVTVVMGVQYNFGGGLRKLAKEDVQLSQLQTRMGICSDISAANLMIDYTKRTDLAFCEGLDQRILPAPQPPASRPDINVLVQQQQETINSLRLKMQQLRTKPTLVKPTW